MKQGLIHVYTGDGKGKTTAALGLILRACGRGLRIVLVQLLKGGETGEIYALENLRGVTVLRYGRDFGFYHSANAQDRAEMTRLNNELLSEARRLAADGQCDLLVLDELCAAYHYQALDRALADDLILNKSAALELVLTGRNAPPHFIDAADYITEFVNRKHPYDSGVAAREGIEF